MFVTRIFFLRSQVFFFTRSRSLIQSVPDRYVAGPKASIHTGYLFASTFSEDSFRNEHLLSLLNMACWLVRASRFLKTVTQIKTETTAVKYKASQIKTHPNDSKQDGVVI